MDRVDTGSSQPIPHSPLQQPYSFLDIRRLSSFKLAQDGGKVEVWCFDNLNLNVLLTARGRDEHPPRSLHTYGCDSSFKFKLEASGLTKQQTVHVQEGDRIFIHLISTT
jgi:hypothetical protein